MLGDGQPPPCMGMHAFKRLARANQQSTYIRYHCRTSPRVALMMYARLQTGPSLAWRLQGRPEYLHGVLGDGQPPPRMGMYALKCCARATQRDSFWRVHTSPTVATEGERRGSGRPNAIEPLHRSAQHRAGRAGSSCTTVGVDSERGSRRFPGTSNYSMGGARRGGDERLMTNELATYACD